MKGLRHMTPFRIIWQSLKTLYEQLFQLFLIGFITLLALLLILPAPIALGGLWGVAHRAVAGHGGDWSEYWEALKRYGSRNWLNSLVVAVVYGLLALNLRFYNTPGITPISADIALVATVFWIGVTLFWTGTLLKFQVLHPGDPPSGNPDCQGYLDYTLCYQCRRTRNHCYYPTACCQQ